MTPSFIGRYAIMFPGVRPTISFASFPTARILLFDCETATTDGSLSTIPFPGTKTRTVVVPRSIPSFGENENAIFASGGIVRQSGYGVQRAPQSPYVFGRGNPSTLQNQSGLLAEIRGCISGLSS